MSAIYAMWLREVKRYLRSRVQIVASLAQPMRYLLILGFGLGYWYEKFEVTDFATTDLPGQPGTPRIANLGEISTGYGNRPYTGNTAFLRLLYQF